MELPKSKYGERFVPVKAQLKTWTIVEDVIEFDTHTDQFIIPNGYQPDTKVIDWKYKED